MEGGEKEEKARGLMWLEGKEGKGEGGEGAREEKKREERRRS